METIRILVKENQVEIFFQTKNDSSPVELIHVVQLSIIEEFIESWENWIRQCDIISFASTNKVHNFRNRLSEFSNSLESILFGNLPIQSQKKIVWILDDKIASLPVEILKISSDQVYYRNIRSNQRPPVGRKNQETILFVENHYRAEKILEQLTEEREDIINIFNENKVKYKEIMGAGCSRIRFLEKAASASILHYAGHSFSRGIRFSDSSELNNSELSTFNLSNLKLVSLNSCSSAIGLARAFLKAGALECVGFLGPVRNDVSRVAGKIFWEAYFELNSVTLAVERVRDELQKEYGDGYPGAFQFVHFGVPRNKERKQNLLFTSIFFLFLGIASALSVVTLLQNSENKTNILNEPLSSPTEVTPEKSKYTPQKSQKFQSEPRNSTPKKQKPLVKESLNIEKIIIYENNPVDRRDKLENYIMSLESPILRRKIRAYLGKIDPLVSKEKKIQKVQDILENNDSEEMIEYKLRQINN